MDIKMAHLTNILFKCILNNIVGRRMGLTYGQEAQTSYFA